MNQIQIYSIDFRTEFFFLLGDYFSAFLLISKSVLGIETS